MSWLSTFVLFARTSLWPSKVLQESAQSEVCVCGVYEWQKISAGERRRPPTSAKSERRRRCSAVKAPSPECNGEGVSWLGIARLQIQASGECAKSARREKRKKESRLLLTVPRPKTRRQRRALVWGASAFKGDVRAVLLRRRPSGKERGGAHRAGRVRDRERERENVWRARAHIKRWGMQRGAGASRRRPGAAVRGRKRGEVAAKQGGGGCECFVYTGRREGAWGALFW